jgi:uncharacterized protein YabE (DUF348 family)
MPGPTEVRSLVRLVPVSLARPRPAVLAVQAAVLTALVGGVVGYTTLDKTVTVAVDGQAREVRSFAGTVDEVLEAEGIEVGSRDVVAPALGSQLRDGTRISVRHARKLSLEVDGKPREVWTTALTVGEALVQHGVGEDRAYVSASRSRRIGLEGLSVDVRTPRQVTFAVDGRKVAVTTTAATVREALAQAKLAVRRQDRVSVPLTAFPAQGQVVKVARVDTRTVVLRKDVAFETVRRDSAELYDGETEVSRAGRPGVRAYRWTVTLVDGKRAARKLVRTAVTRQPVDRLVLVGTREKPKPKPKAVAAASSGGGQAAASGGGQPASDGLNWAALAACESGGNPRAVNPAGYYGLYQFSQSTWNGVGGSGRPDQASPSEQLYRAQILYKRGGAGQWGCGHRL